MSLSCSPDSLINPLTAPDAALTELTSKLTPGYAKKIAVSTLSDVDQAMTEVICQVLTEELRDVPRHVLLGKLALLFASRLKETQSVIDMQQLKLGTADAHWNWKTKNSELA